MAFEKGRAKTGGRQKGGPTRKATKFIDQLKVHGFNYPKEMAETLIAIKNLRAELTDPAKAAAAATKLAELKFYYTEIKSLLPVMAPKLREKEVEVVEDDSDPSAPPQKQVTDDELLKALGNGQETDNNSRPSNQDVLAAGNSQLQIPTGASEDLPNLVGEQEEDE